MTNNKVVIRSNTIQQWLTNKNPFDAVRGIKGLVVRCVDGRTTQRFEINGEGFYSKYHLGVGWTEIVKNLIRFRLPILGAKNEWLAINRLQELNVDTLTGSAFGSKGINPASKQSFIITEELVDVISLEDLTREWANSAPDFTLKKLLIERIAMMSRTMHEAGINHRDLYICHFLLPNRYLHQESFANDFPLYLIDLHRAQMRSAVPRRWLIKDVASLYFSVLNIGITRKDIFRFLRCYYQKSLRDIFNSEDSFLLAVEKRAVSLYRRDFKCEPTLPC